MKHFHKVKFYLGSKEETFSDFANDFPFVIGHADFDKNIRTFSPWHWHKELELFYIKTGVLEYQTPKKNIIFPAGTGGIVNSNILHMTRLKSEKVVQYLQIFDSSIISGQQGSRIEQKYVIPLITASHIEIIPLKNLEHEPILNLIKKAYTLSEKDIGYEIEIRSLLSKIWLEIYMLISPMVFQKNKIDKVSDKLKSMMVFIHEHYFEELSVMQIANAGFCSERDCFRIFKNYLRMSPLSYLNGYRLQKACYLLAKTSENITTISNSCGYSNSSYFGKIFKKSMQYTPTAYRGKWQKNTI